MLTGLDLKAVAYFAISDADEAVGFAEVSLRTDHVNGCDKSPVAFLEGFYVGPNFRRVGIAASLLGSVEDCARSVGCIELGSDADWENADGHAFHTALGFTETERIIFFKKSLELTLTRASHLSDA